MKDYDVTASDHHVNRPRATLDNKEWVLADYTDLPRLGPLLPALR